MTERIALVTGANTGIGKVTALELARSGAEVFLACRNLDKARSAIDEIQAEVPNAKVEPHALDLSSLSAVKESAEAFLAKDKPLHILVNNAGLAGQKGLTKDGFELAFGVNHLGHFLFTQLLEPRLRQSAPARVVIVASQAHYRLDAFDLGAVREAASTVTAMTEYALSKLANVLHAAELGRRLEGTGVTTYSLHPGVVASDVWREVPWPFRSLMKLFMSSNEEGAATSLHCATDPAAGEETGLYYDKCRPKKPSDLAADPAVAKELWTKSEAWLAEHIG
jgi:NAD(P)-dependent dehydrogenase (short-subunit alcohol dehydrogenase family)